jgi:tRNA-splicing ligase RtcB
MTAAANTAFANRQMITHRVREVFEAVFATSAEDLGLSVVYDVCHNTAKRERHLVDGKPVDLIVHRKGATRAFGPGADDLPPAYRDVGQPVIIGGSMETGSALSSGPTRHGGRGLDARLDAPCRGRRPSDRSRAMRSSRTWPRGDRRPRGVRVRVAGGGSPTRI